ncbi:MAG TPA: bifunctional [glutamate--ammonia ligase]-adenylyl-L-tyrosine phosphorylase/[glutamate--ammonia-ligase] adenylyltransferase [Rhodanobacteraceae bacterium]|nr:bifunctional [glutamate--ammonia ligase]-adenylyl-L-tyrosine phosphorylase/[glutamate--ammonia-ligase] adenylyltransferase [Rhodanobacteraceae bacterium]
MDHAPMPQPLPAELETWLDERWAGLRARAAGIEPVADPAGLAAWRRTLLASDFAFDVLQRQPQWLAAGACAALCEAGDAAAVEARVNDALKGHEGDARFMAALRRVRHAEALRLIYRSVNGLDALEQTLAQTSALYAVLTSAALARAEAAIATRHGQARAADGSVQRLVVLAMGKLGGGELNFSSDIDLILAYGEAGESDGPRPLSNDEYFTRLGRELVRLLAERTADGSVARVDLRLRPFGRSGRLALSFEAMEQYYQREGRDWERYAWIKARPLAGDIAAGERLIETLRPFVYRRYLDYTAFAGLREMKALIDAEVGRKELDDNIKLGAGGIREIEFCVQLLQLIRGGRETDLRVRGLLDALAVCERRGLVDQASAGRLRAAYIFLRQLENRLQMFADAQTHSAPADSVARQRIALALDYPDWPALAADLERHRAVVRAEFAALLLPHAGANAESAAAADVALWRAAVDGDLSDAMLEARGFVPGAAVRAELAALPGAAAVRAMSARSAARLDRLMPHLLAAAQASVAPVEGLRRLCRLVQAVARRSSYLTLLEEQPLARQRLAALCADSAWLAERVIAQPLLLDDVLDPRIDQLPLRRAEITATIGEALANLDRHDAEAELERLAETRASLAFRLGLAFRDGQVEAPATARRLAALAEAVVAAVLVLARADLRGRHGMLGDGGGFAVLGYGSLGGAELGFASDLDLVFVYDEALATQRSDGPQPLEGTVWLQRLAQRIVHWLGALHRGGRLYEVDTRLRPDGSKGLLVTSMPAFAGYQRERAWSWEHQALLRARGVAGDGALLARFDALRRDIVCAPRDPARVRAEVSDMRVRWRRERDRSDARRIDLKQGRGGLVDLEFMLQGLVLAHAAAHPALARGHSTPQWLCACRDASLLPAAATEALAAAHARLLGRSLRCALDARPRLVERDPDIDAASTTIARAAQAAGFDL